MISKSVKAKRRRFASYYKAIRLTQVTLIDRRPESGTHFYLISTQINSPADPNLTHHLEATNLDLLKKYAEMLGHVAIMHKK